MMTLFSGVLFVWFSSLWKTGFVHFFYSPVALISFDSSDLFLSVENVSFVFAILSSSLSLFHQLEKETYFTHSNSKLVFLISEPKPKACNPQEETAKNKDRSELGTFLLQVCSLLQNIRQKTFFFLAHHANMPFCVLQIPAWPCSVQPHLELEDEGGAAGCSGGRDACIQCGPWAWQWQRYLLEPPGIWGL